ncbi:MAG TPA: polysaccharide deacetylase family protein [Opitutales bacterium]|nr:polysaccharide deacetylase family protein [Opitutales bacterium]
MKALVSIHDVMPHTLGRVERILDWLKALEVPPVTLLVVPGRPWAPEQIDRLRDLAAAGYELAAHGWRHETAPRHLYHRLHAALISRQVAEHLDLDSRGIRQLMQRSRDWFAQNELPLPDFYVPPAWALGPISKAELAQAPYRLVETTRGLWHKAADASQRASATAETEPEHPGKNPPPLRFQKLPLTGYEADTLAREYFLRCWNAAQARSAGRKQRPLRISIHPDDLDLRVADQMKRQIQAVETFLPYTSLKNL